MGTPSNAASAGPSGKEPSYVCKAMSALVRSDSTPVSESRRCEGGALDGEYVMAISGAQSWFPLYGGSQSWSWREGGAKLATERDRADKALPNG